MLLPFTKMHGLGNDFFVVEALSRDVSLSSAQIRQLACRKTGVGFDQLLMIEPPKIEDVDFNYRIFNADGSEVEHCGNGVRCLGKLVSDKKFCGKKNIRVSTSNTIVEIRQISHDQFQVDMGKPRFAPDDLPFKTSEVQEFYTLTHTMGSTEVAICSMGNPHAVIAVDDVDTANVEQLGPLIEGHKQFPERVNAGFMQIVDRSQLRLRVFERGVGETSACGTGACAAMAVARRFDLIDSEVTVSLPGGDLKIDWNSQDETLKMAGPAVTVFEGKIKL